MAIIRVNKNKDNPYVTLNKLSLEDDNLSFKAKGIHAYLMSKPDNWKCNILDLKKNSRDGRDSIYAGLKELRKHGYLIKRYIKNDKNIIVSWEEFIYETPQEEAIQIFKLQEKSKPKRKKPDTENPDMEKARYGFSVNGKAVSGKPEHIINTNILSTNIINNELVVEVVDIPTAIEYFENNICELKQTTLKKFIEICSNNDFKLIEAIIDNCAENNAKSFAYFQKVINAVESNEIKSAQEFRSFIEAYRANKNSKRNKPKHNNKKEDTFNNFDQRKYDYDELEKDLLGWNDEQEVNN